MYVKYVGQTQSQDKLGCVDTSNLLVSTKRIFIHVCIFIGQTQYLVSGDIFISRISRGKRMSVANARCVTHVHVDVDGTSKGGLSIRAISHIDTS